MITNIKTKAFRRGDLSIALAARTLLIGPNGTGKTTVIHAATLALQGYLQGQKATAAELFANCTDDKAMSVQAEVEAKGITHSIMRSWEKNKKGEISGMVSVDKTLASSRNADGMVRMALGETPILVDVAAIRMSPQKERRRLFLQAIGVDLDTPLRDEQDARALINQARANREAASNTASRLMAELTTLPEATGSVEQMEARLKELTTQRDQLVRELAAADAADRERAQTEAAKGRMHQHSAKVEALRGKAKDCSRRIAELSDKITADSNRLTKMREEHVPARLQICIESWASTLRPIAEAATVVGEMTAILNDADRPDTVDEAEKNLDKAVAALTAAKLEMANITRDGKQAVENMKEDDELAKRDVAPGVTDEDRARLEGLTQAITSTQAALGPANRRKAITGEVERSRIEVDKQTAIEQEAKDRLDKAMQAQKDAAASANAAINQRMQKMLPYGCVELVDEGQRTTLAWNMGTRTVPWETLSGGERVMFDAAIGYLVGGNDATVFLDAAEVDAVNMEHLLESLGKAGPKQIIMAHHTNPRVTNSAWTVQMMAA